MTLDWYSANVDRFFDESVGVDLSSLHEAFLAGVAPGGHILDLGCGSGRDSLVFRDRGYVVTAIEPCVPLARKAAALLGMMVESKTAQELDGVRQFDGVWACASLLHVPDSDSDSVLQRIERALVPRGILYASFKAGDGERLHEGRFFRDHTEASLARVLGAVGFSIERLWTTDDVRAAHTGERWTNVLARARP